MLDNTKIFPLAMIALDLASAVMCGIDGDWRRTVYWIAAAVLNVTVTF